MIHHSWLGKSKHCFITRDLANPNISSLATWLRLVARDEIFGFASSLVMKQCFDLPRHSWYIIYPNFHFHKWYISFKFWQKWYQFKWVFKFFQKMIIFQNFAFSFHRTLLNWRMIIHLIHPKWNHFQEFLFRRDQTIDQNCLIVD